MRIFSKFVFHLLALLSLSLAHAGSYEDFFQAVRQDDGRRITELLQRGFDANALDPARTHGLFIAVKEGSLKAADALIAWPKTRVEWRSPKDESPLMLAALKGQTEIVRKLIARDAHVNKTGWAPLHYAATGGHVEIIQILLDEHAYIDAESPNKSTPLMMAAKYGTPAAVKLLLESGADPRLRNELGLSAIEFAQQGNRRDSAEMIAAAIRAKYPKGKW
ncbi:ankyrin repeat domain-containing protein [Ramlibacter alkalitolerans]|jgi:ankyrin repeat protein|uniref:Ankyrin repeat domain-containing protein n=1 Tax=Ramlibacter alkalitolerans TaxID=2039631 RepID=A0ABS1JTN8_9BURK|nr:ankyrin repeat domain-containing protein [Ramlibacter alkalitolerans]MBL0427604.1 ankyrin repeat domain-containing protein [Ramlibacter alkalitolerans]